MKQIDIPDSDPLLRHAYDAWNAKYFGGNLPSSVVLWFEPMDCHGHFYDGVNKPGRQKGLTKGERDEFYIRVDLAGRYSKARWGLDLLHEMAHLKCYPVVTHGNLWKKEMLRLMQAGAFWGLI